MSGKTGQTGHAGQPIITLGDDQPGVSGRTRAPRPTPHPYAPTRRRADALALLDGELARSAAIVERLAASVAALPIDSLAGHPLLVLLAEERRALHALCRDAIRASNVRGIGRVADAVANGDRRAALLQLRDHVAAQLDRLNGVESAALAGRLVDVLRELDDIPLGNDSIVDQLSSRREARRAGS